jgi:hypothetical protein
LNRRAEPNRAGPEGIATRLDAGGPASLGARAIVDFIDPLPFGSRIRMKPNEERDPS